MTNDGTITISTQDVKDQLSKGLEKSQIMLVYVCSLLLFSWALFDYFLFPFQFKQFLLLRFIFSLIPTAVCYFRKELGVNMIFCLFTTALSVTVLNAYIINIISEKEFRTFVLAYIIYFIGVGMLALWEIYYSFLLVIITIILNAVLYYSFSSIPLGVYLIDGQIAIITVAVFSILLVNIRYKLSLKEVRSRMELEISNQTIQVQRDTLSAYANQMEQLVLERTSEVREKSMKITEQKIFYDAIFFNIPIEISIFNEKHEYLFANKMAVPDDQIRSLIIGKTDKEYCDLTGLDKQKSERREEQFLQSLQDKKSIDFEDVFTDDSGFTVYKQFGFYPIYEGDKLQFMIFYATDITAKKKYEIKIEDALKEKEALLGEVHHRVKNNLALITGLIEFQKIKIVDESVKKEFDDIKHRITSMALIHETLYKSANFANVDLSQCVRELSNQLKNFYSRSKEKEIKLLLDLEPIPVPTKIAIPIALMINEMITNCYKHAFSETNKGEIKINLSKSNGYLEFIISDNGKGFDTTMDPLKNNSLGMKLISIFVKQIKGNLEFKNLSGLTIRVLAPIE